MTRSKLRTAMKIVGKTMLWGGVLAAALLTIAHLTWKYSGSGQWRLIRESNGVKVYAMKSPGDTLEKFRAVGQIRVTTKQVELAMRDTSSEACADFVPGCNSGEILEAWTPQSQYYVQYYRVEFPRPFAPRDLVLKTAFSLEPDGKTLQVQCTSQPGRRSEDAGYVRVDKMRNTWRFTPIENGKVEVEFVADYDMKVPYFLFNHEIPAALCSLLPHLQEVLNKPK
jgi:hypothetical protein